MGEGQDDLRQVGQVSAAPVALGEGQQRLGDL
jgi:hypothetical protein